MWYNQEISGDSPNLHLFEQKLDANESKSSVFTIL